MRPGVRGRLFLVMLGLIALSTLAGDAYLAPALDADQTEALREDLFVRLALVERAASHAALAPGDREGWDALADDLGRRAAGRVTLVRGDGAVLGDSELDGAALARVESHADRPEVVQALAARRAEVVRFSATLRLRMMYVATPFGAGRARGVARLAVSMAQVDAAVAKLRRTLLAGSGVALLLAALVASLAAHLYSRSVRATTAVARRMAAGDLAARAAVPGGDEVAQLGRALDELARGLSATLEKLRAERDLLDRVLRGMREGVLLLDRGGRVALANPALRELLLLPADVSGRLPLELARNARLQETLERAAGPERAASAELDLEGLQPRRVLVQASALEGEPGGVLAVFVDVTELRRLETLRRDFVANVSHELRTPIAGVLSAAETLAGGALADPAAAGRFVEIIQQDATRLRQLVEDLLELSRIESRGLRLSPEIVELEPFARQVLASFDERARARRLRTGVHAAPGATRALVDRRALEHVLANLVDNAVKYASEGAAVTVRAEPAPGAVKVTVADTGPGIEARHLPRLFERFYRVDAGRSRELGGTGLGLAIVKHLVEAMGGETGVESAVGRGTQVWFTLPAA